MCKWRFAACQASSATTFIKFFASSASCFRAPPGQAAPCSRYEKPSRQRGESSAVVQPQLSGRDAGEVNAHARNRVLKLLRIQRGRRFYLEERSTLAHQHQQLERKTPQEPQRLQKRRTTPRLPLKQQQRLEDWRASVLPQLFSRSDAEHVSAGAFSFKKDDTVDPRSMVNTKGGSGATAAHTAAATARGPVTSAAATAVAATATTTTEKAAAPGTRSRSSPPQGTAPAGAVLDCTRNGSPLSTRDFKEAKADVLQALPPALGPTHGHALRADSSGEHGAAACRCSNTYTDHIVHCDDNGSRGGAWAATSHLWIQYMRAETCANLVNAAEWWDACSAGDRNRARFSAGPVVTADLSEGGVLFQLTPHGGRLPVNARGSNHLLLQVFPGEFLRPPLLPLDGIEQETPTNRRGSRVVLRVLGSAPAHQIFPPLASGSDTGQMLVGYGCYDELCYQLSARYATEQPSGSPWSAAGLMFASTDRASATRVEDFLGFPQHNLRASSHATQRHPGVAGDSWPWGNSIQRSVACLLPANGCHASLLRTKPPLALKACGATAPLYIPSTARASFMAPGDGAAGALGTRAMVFEEPTPAVACAPVSGRLEKEVGRERMSPVSLLALKEDKQQTELAGTGGSALQSQQGQDVKKRPTRQGGRQAAEEKTPVGVTHKQGDACSRQVQHWLCEMPVEEPKRIRALAFLLRTWLVDLRPHDRGIVFCASQLEAALLASHPLFCSLAKPLHEGLSSDLRAATLRAFYEGVFAVLVCTDKAAAKENMPRVGLVAHYGPPSTPVVYMRRASYASRLPVEENERKGGYSIRTDASTGRSREEGDAAFQNRPGLSVLLVDRGSLQHQALARHLSRLHRAEFSVLTLPAAAVMDEQSLDQIEQQLVSPAALRLGVPLQPAAELQLRQHGPRLLAAAFALLLQKQHRMIWRCALSDQFTRTPLLFQDPCNRILRSKQALLQLLDASLFGTSSSRRVTDKNGSERSGFHNTIEGRRTAEGGSGSSSRTGQNYVRKTVTTDLTKRLFAAGVGRIRLCPSGYVAEVAASAARRLLQSDVLSRSGVKVTYMTALHLLLDSSRQMRRKGRRRRRAACPSLEELTRLQQRVFLAPSKKARLRAGRILAAKRLQRDMHGIRVRQRQVFAASADAVS